MIGARLAPLLAIVAFGCGSAPPLPDLGADMGSAGDLSRGVSPLAPPAGFGAACTMSSQCRGYAQDQPPWYLGCESYIGIDYCSRPCSPTSPCWMGTICECVTRTNAGGISESDCYCARP